MPNELVTCGLLSDTEAARENATTLAASRVTAMKQDGTKLEEAEKKVLELTAANADLKKKVDEAADEKKKAAEKRADEIIASAVADGRIGAQDEATKKEYRERLAAGDAFAEKVLAGLPKQHEGIDKPVIEANAADAPAGKQGKDSEKPPMDRLAASIAAGK